MNLLMLNINVTEKSNIFIVIESPFDQWLYFNNVTTNTAIDFPPLHTKTKFINY